MNPTNPQNVSTQLKQIAPRTSPSSPKVQVHSSGAETVDSIDPDFDSRLNKLSAVDNDLLVNSKELEEILSNAFKKISTEIDRHSEAGEKFIQSVINHLAGIANITGEEWSGTNNDVVPRVPTDMEDVLRSLFLGEADSSFVHPNVALKNLYKLDCIYSMIISEKFETSECSLPGFILKLGGGLMPSGTSRNQINMNSFVSLVMEIVNNLFLSRKLQIHFIHMGNGLVKLDEHYISPDNKALLEMLLFLFNDFPTPLKTKLDALKDEDKAKYIKYSAELYSIAKNNKHSSILVCNEINKYVDSSGNVKDIIDTYLLEKVEQSKKHYANKRKSGWSKQPKDTTSVSNHLPATITDSSGIAAANQQLPDSINNIVPEPKVVEVSVSNNTITRPSEPVVSAANTNNTSDVLFSNTVASIVSSVGNQAMKNTHATPSSTPGKSSFKNIFSSNKPLVQSGASSSLTLGQDTSGGKEFREGLEEKSVNIDLSMHQGIRAGNGYGVLGSSDGAVQVPNLTNNNVSEIIGDNSASTTPIKQLGVANTSSAGGALSSAREKSVVRKFFSGSKTLIAWFGTVPSTFFGTRTLNAEEEGLKLENINEQHNDESDSSDSVHGNFVIKQDGVEMQSLDD